MGVNLDRDWPYMWMCFLIHTTQKNLSFQISLPHSTGRSKPSIAHTRIPLLVLADNQNGFPLLKLTIFSPQTSNKN